MQHRPRNFPSAIRSAPVALAGHSARLRATVSRALGRAFRYRGLTVLVLWQAPVGPVVAPDGSIGLTFGGGRYELTQVSCEGDVLDARSVGYTIAAAELDGDVGSRTRVVAAGGIISSTQGSHGFGAVQLRADWKHVGIGGGLAAIPFFDELDAGTEALPSVHLRIGPAERLHARADLVQPTGLMPQQLLRIGVGWNATRRDQPAGVVGLGVVGSDEGATGVAGEVTVPVGERTAFRLIGHVGTGRRHTVTGLVVGGRVLLD